MKKITFVILIVLLSTPLIIGYQYVKFNDHKLHIIICDVGQGDGIFIRTPRNQDIVIDGGPDDSILSCLAKHMPFWDRAIDLMILTHPHADHITGLIDVIKRYKVMGFYTEKVGNTTDIYEILIKTLKDYRIKEQFVWQGDNFRFKDGLFLKILWPTPDWVNRNAINEGNLDINGFSVIASLSYGNFKALFTGDAGAVAIEKIDDLVGKIDLLKVPHHGSKTGLTEDILRVLNPKVAVISVGKKNRYGHPATFTLELLKSKNIKTLRTDQNGEVEIVSDGEGWYIQ